MEFQQFEDYVHRLMDDHHVPGMAVGINRSGERIYQKGFGLRDLENDLPADENTVFGTASVTKSMTAAAVLLLVEEGKLSLEDTAVHYIPELRDIIPEPYLNQIKVYHLLSHSTGLAPVKRDETINLLEDHLRYLKETETQWIGKPGEWFSYSNDMYLLSGLIIERLTGEVYREFMTKTFLNPLGMSRSTFNPLKLGKMENVTIPYEYLNRKHDPCEWPVLGNYEVGGGLRSTVTDMLKYGDYILQGNVAERLAFPRIQLPMGQSYGHGFQVRRYDGTYTLIEHSGGQPGVSSHFGVIPEAGLSAIVLTNLSGVNAPSVWLKLVNTVLGLPIDRQRFDYEPITLPLQSLEIYKGYYTSKEGDRVDITILGNELQVSTYTEKYQFKPIGNHIFVDEKECRLMEFYINEENKQAWGVLFGSRILQRMD